MFLITMYMCLCNIGISHYFCECTQNTISLKFSFLLSCSIHFYRFFGIRKIKIPNNCLHFLGLLKLFLSTMLQYPVVTLFIVCSQSKVLITVTLWYTIIVIENSFLKSILSSYYIFHKILTKKLKNREVFVKILEWSFSLELPITFIITNLCLTDKSLLPLAFIFNFLPHLFPYKNNH